MRILLLRRQPLGGIATLTNTLALALKKRGVEAVVEEASDWIPNQTDIASSRPATKQLRTISANYGLVHAFGYRAAWACSDAFGPKEAWVYTAYDMPKTTHKLLIDKLNEAQLGFCSSYAVRDALAKAGALDVSVRTPCAPHLASLLDKEDARRVFEAEVEGPLIAGLGRLVPERGFAILAEAMEQVWIQVHDAQLVVAGDGPELEQLRAIARQSSRAHQIHVYGPVRNAADLYKAADLLVVPSTRAGFSMVAAEAMLCGTPVMVREGPLDEMVQRDNTGLLFASDRELGLRIAEAIQTPIRLESVSNAARIKAEALFSPDRFAEEMEKKYREIVEDD